MHWLFLLIRGVKVLHTHAHTHIHIYVATYVSDLYFVCLCKQEPTLRAMQYLPGILKLQKYLFDHFHQQIGQEKALSETIGNYKRTLKKGKSLTNTLLGYQSSEFLFK